MTPKPVLFTTDFSEHSLAGLEWARKLADDFDVPLHCAYVCDDSPFLWVGASGFTPPSPDEVHAEALKKMEGFEKEHLGGLKKDKDPPPPPKTAEDPRPDYIPLDPYQDDERKNRDD